MTCAERAFLQKLCTQRKLRRCRRCSENKQQIYREHPFRSVTSIKLFCNFMEIALQRGCSPVNWLHILRTTFNRNTSGGLLLEIY